MPRLPLVALTAITALIAHGCADDSALDQVVSDLEADDPGATTSSSELPPSDPGTEADGEPGASDADAESDTDADPDATGPDLAVDEQAVVDSLSGGAVVDGVEAACLIDGINDASISPTDVLTNSITLQDELTVSDLVLTCFEHPENLAGFVQNFADGFAVTAERSLTPDQAVCMVAALATHDTTMSSFDANEGLSPGLIVDLEECLFGPNDGQFEPGRQYGDNPTLDRLWDECEGGVLVSCDQLYSISEIDSDYEAFGKTCGDREPDAAGGSCDAPNSYGDSSVLDAYWDACEAGDGVACDDLYFESPFGSVYEAFGNTCGYRFEESPGFCEDVLP